MVQWLFQYSLIRRSGVRIPETQTQIHDIYYLYYYRVVAIHISPNFISTSANHILNEADTSWPAGCWRMTSQ